MSGVVLDASALLALLLDEPGATRVKDALDGSMMSTVNLAEVVSYYAKLGAGRAEIQEMLRGLPIRYASDDPDLAHEVGMLRPVTLAAGLSLGDRYCLALAKREDRNALTGERRWTQVAASAGVGVELIR